MELKQYLFIHFQTKSWPIAILFWDWGSSIRDKYCYFSRKYALEILEEIEMLDCKLVHVPMD